MKRVLHFFPTISHLGGVESILRLHARLDKTLDWDSRVLIACESDKACRAFGTFGLDVRGWNDIATLKRRFDRSCSSFQPDLVVFHNLWAARHLLPYLSKCKKVGLLHSASEENFQAVRNCSSQLDLILTVSKPLAEKAKDLSNGKIPVVAIDIPINPPEARTHKFRGDRPLLVGYAGRIVIEQKRCDRLSQLIDETLKHSSSVRFEILGSGSYETAMREHFKTHSLITFSGLKTGADYWNTIRQWDAIISTSDYEGTPLTILEALSQGVVPVFPRIQSGVDNYVDQIDPHLLYDKENIVDGAAKLTALAQMPVENFETLRNRAIALAGRHRPEIYLSKFFSELEKACISSRSPENQPSIRKNFEPLLFVPLFLIKKFFPRAIY